ncbi:hypothetical protein TNCV_3175461 [Trichonephila clavipes]|nr:hypothetical protein TNCV_3175461 [Trichonephila clavipes]
MPTPDIYSSDTLSQTQVFEWHRRFREDWESFEDAKHSGRPQTSPIAENTEKVSAVLASVSSGCIRFDLNKPRFDLITETNRGLLVTEFMILNPVHMTITTPELDSSLPNFPTTPMGSYEPRQIKSASTPLHDGLVGVLDLSTPAMNL